MKAECDKVRNDGGNFGQPLQRDDEMKTNDGGMKENVQWQTQRENYRKRREAKLIFREGRKIILRIRVRIKGWEEAVEVETKERINKQQDVKNCFPNLSIIVLLQLARKAFCILYYLCLKRESQNKR